MSELLNPLARQELQAGLPNLWFLPQLFGFLLIEQKQKRRISVSRGLPSA
jgi:hypothetical protein